jgi:hypothetical protein
MRKIKNRMGWFGMALTGLLLAGCILSGTFVISHKFTLSSMGSFFFYQVDITNEQVWKDHSDNIDFIDAVGLELYITSTEPTAVTFNAYVDNYSGDDSNPVSVPTGIPIIIEDMTVSTGKTFITYAKSLTLIKNLDVLKKLVKKGKFDFYATTTGTPGTTFVVDSARIVVTLSASK